MSHPKIAALLLCCCLSAACGGQVLGWPEESDVAVDCAPVVVQVYEFAATANSVPAPDYALTVGGLALLVDANNIVQSATGTAELTPGLVTAQRYVVADAVGLHLYSEIDEAFVASADKAFTTSIPAVDFALVGADLTTSKVRTLILANLAADVPAYQSFEIIFHPAR
jgi:hypothetical protein